MAYYSDELREEILNTADIVSVVGDYVKLTRTGSNYVGLCPFHKEKTGSFHVSSSKQIFKCFGCGLGGNAIHFISKIENLDYGETLEFMADKLNIDATKYQKNNVKVVDKDMKERIFSINKQSAQFFHDSLKEEIKKNSDLKKYLEKRQLDMNTVINFGLGFGGKQNGGIYKYLLALGYTKEEIIKAGVATIASTGNVYEWLNSRLIFPIIDTRDRVIGFGGRVLDQSLPKYINSPENVVYYKGNNLYGLNVAKKQLQEYIILTEGYMDTVALHKSGITSAVAGLGTSLTDNQAKLIKKYSQTCIISYDQDSAGQKATMRSIDILLAQGLKVKVLRLNKSDTKDPDEYINKYGTKQFLECIKNSQSYVEYKVEKAKDTLNTNSFDGKLEFLNTVTSIFSQIENEIERDMYMTDISKKFNIDKSVLQSELEKKKENNDAHMEKEKQSEITLSKYLYKKQLGLNDPRLRQEQYIIALSCLDDKKISQYVLEKFNENDFLDEMLKKIFITIKDTEQNKDKKDILSLFSKEEEIIKLTDAMYIDLSQFNIQKLVVDLEKSFKKYRYMALREKILNKIKDVNTDDDERQMLSIELNELMKKIAKKG